MTEAFLNAVNMSISAGWIVLAVLFVRLLLKKAPKWIVVLLWGVVGIRLICPFAVESVMSLIPSAETISPQALVEEPAINTGVSFLNNTLNPVIRDATIAVSPEKSVNVLQLVALVFSKLWVVGIGAMLLYTAVSFIRLKRKVGTAVLLRENVYQSENVAFPFVLGLFRPRIYLPFSLSEADREYVIAHEKAHICRRDHWWKPLGFLLLSIHWFNPLMWLGYVMLCRDIELACDEKVIREFDREQKADYSQALLSCSVSRRRIAACPLAFGETSVKSRVRSVLNYKKPAFWIVALAILACIAVALCFLTNPLTKPDEELSVFLDMEIAAHNGGKETEEGIFAVVHHKVLGMERSFDRVTVYLWSMYQEYALENGKIVEKAGSHIPLAITAKRTGKHGHYELVEYWQPRDGSYNVKDIREKFPWYLHAKALDSQRYVREQEEFCRKAAQEYFADALSQVGGVDTPTKLTEYLSGNPFFYGKVLAIYDGQVLMEALKDSEMIRKGSTYYVSTRVKDAGIPLPEIKVGTELAVVFDGEIAETYPAQIRTVYAIYLASELEAAIAKSTASDSSYTQKVEFDPSAYPKIGEGSRVSETFLQTEAEAVRENYDKGEFVITKTHHRMDDGIWVWIGNAYLYRLELTGKGSGMEKNTTFIVLSNRKDVTFEEAWKAEFSSNTEDFFNPRETVTVARKVSK